MIIRTEQLEVLQARAEVDFENRVVGHMLKKHSKVSIRFPACTVRVAEIPEEVLHEMIRNGLARARKYGMRYESSLAAFVSLMFAIAPNFDQHPLIQGVLRDDKESPDSRIELFCEQITDENWEAAEQGYDPKAWNVELPSNPPVSR